MDTTKLRAELDWSPTNQFADGLRSTVQWYLDNEAWVAEVRPAAFRRAGLG
jgi:dTDP-glucose 4,6-dehydratase